MEKTQGLISSKNWTITPSQSPKDNLHTSDKLIEAYELGVQIGISKNDKLIYDKLISNLNNAGDITGKLINHLKKINFNPQSAHLRINSFDDFTVLLVLPEENFLSDQIYSVYNHITNIEEESREDFFNITFSISDFQTEFNESLASTEGFHLTFLPKKI